MTLIGLCYAELMAMLPEAAGAVGYVRRAFGTAVAFATGWLLLLTYTATIAFFIVTLSWLMPVLAPGLGGLRLYTVQGAPVRLGPTLAAAAVGLALGWANCRGIAAERVQSAIVGVKIVLVAGLAAAALLGGHADNLAPLVPDGHAWSGIAAVLVTTPFWFGGFDVLPQAMRERSAHVRLSRLGWLIIVTTAAALLFYTAIILATACLAPRALLLGSTLPVFTAFRTGLHSAPLAGAVILLGALGVCSGWNANLFSGARVALALARAGLVPAWFGAIDPIRCTPVRATVALGTAGMALGMLGPAALEPVIGAASIALVATLAVLCAGLLRLRRAEPNLARPYRVPQGVPAVAIVLSLVLLVLSILEPLSKPRPGVPLAWVIVAVWVAAGALFWETSPARRARPRRALTENG